MVRWLNGRRERLASQRSIRHFTLLVAELLASVHRETTGSDAEAYALWAILSTVTLLTVEFGKMFCDGHRIEKLVA